MSKVLNSEIDKSFEDNGYFVCEICGEVTPIDCEGSEPNTCAMCMPIEEEY